MKLKPNIDEQKYNSIDLFRFICAIFVVMIHVNPFGNANRNIIFKYLDFGITQYLSRLAVPFFFITSGFFLYRKTVYSSFSFNNSKKYIRRILKLYILWSIIYLPLTIYDIVDSKNYLFSVAEYIHNVFL